MRRRGLQATCFGDSADTGPALRIAARSPSPPQDCFFYSLVFDPVQKTLLADQGEIRVGCKYQAEIPDRLAEGEQRTGVWLPASLPSGSEPCAGQVCLLWAATLTECSLGAGRGGHSGERRLRVEVPDGTRQHPAFTPCWGSTAPAFSPC